MNTAIGWRKRKWKIRITDLKNNFLEKILVILDLDETLIHATDKPFDNRWEHELFSYKVYVRPHLDFFLEELKDHFQVAVWSSASDDYVEKVVELIFPKDYPLLFVWGRSRCTYKPDYHAAEQYGYFDHYHHYEYIKRIDKVKKRFGISKERMLIIDDTPKKSMYNFGNAIYPAEFKGHAGDNELQLLHQYLLTLKDFENVRTIEKRQWKKQVSGFKDK